MVFSSIMLQDTRYKCADTNNVLTTTICLPVDVAFYCCWAAHLKVFIWVYVESIPGTTYYKAVIIQQWMHTD